MKVSRLPLLLIITTTVGFYAYSRLQESQKRNDEFDFFFSSAEIGDIVQTVSATGNFRPIGVVGLGSQASGQIAEVLVDFNEKVYEGQVLARLDKQVPLANLAESQAALAVAFATSKMSEASLHRSKAALENARTRRSIAEARLRGLSAEVAEAKKTVDRIRTLVNRSIISTQELDRAEVEYLTRQAALDAAALEIELEAGAIRLAEAEVRISDAQLENRKALIAERKAGVLRAEIELKRTDIRSPLTGIVIDRSVEVGNSVSLNVEQLPLFTLAENLTNMELYVEIDEADIASIKEGQIADLSVDAFPERLFQGEVRQIRKLGDRANGLVTYTAIILVWNPDQLLLPGMTAIVDIVISRTARTLIVPNSALRFKPQLSVTNDKEDHDVWILSPEGSLKRIDVKLGVSDGISTEIIESDLKEGDRVIIGTKVTPKMDGFFGIRLGI